MLGNAYLPLKPPARAAPRLCRVLHAHPSPKTKLFHVMGARRFGFLPFPGPNPCPGRARAGEAEGYLGLCKIGKEIANKTLHLGISCGYLPSSFMCK